MRIWALVVLCMTVCGLCSSINIYRRVKLLEPRFRRGVHPNIDVLNEEVNKRYIADLGETLNQDKTGWHLPTLLDDLKEKKLY